MAVQRDKVIANAEKLVAKGKVEAAIKEYERLLDDNPNDVNTLNRIGDLWVRINRNDEACKVYGKIADHYSRDGFFLKAIAIYKKINKLDPSKLDVYAKLADLYAKQGLAMEAKSQYQVLADYYLKHGDSANALAIYRKISDLDPNSINVHVKLADLYSQNGQTGEALKEYDRVGRMLLKRGMLDEAVQVFRKALRIDARNIELVESLVNSLFDAKDYNNAQQIVELALDANREHPRLTAMWAKILLAKGDTASARSALERGLAANPTDTAMRETLAELYAKENNPDKALEIVAPVVEKSLARGERNVAVEMLNRIHRAAPSHAPTLEKLVAVYTRLNEETNIVSALSTLAEACLAERNYEQAAKALERLIEREPQNAQHRTKLQFVMQQMGVKAPISTRPQTPPQPAAPPPPRPDISLAMELEEPVPTFDIEEPTEPAIAIDFDPSPPIELDFGAVAEPPPIPAPVVPEAEIPSAVEEEEDLDFVTEHLTEAEVFAKYGLAEKAAEHLRAVLERSPRNVTAHERLYRLLLDEGAFADARAAALNFINVLREKGDTDAIDAVHNEFLSRGQSLEAAPAKPARPATQEVPRPKTVERPKPKTVEKPAPPPPVVEPDSLLATEIAASEEISIDLDSGGVNFDVDAINLDTAMAGGDEAQAVVPGPEIEAVASEPAFDFGAPAEEPPLFAEEPAAVADEPSFEQLGEIDFYIEQELYDEARRKVEVLLVSYPDHPSLLERLERLEQAAAASAAPPPPPAPSRPPTLSRDEIESELLAAIPEDDEMTIPAPPPQAVEPPAAPVAAIAPEHEESLFADEDNFFDLASELESELAEDLEPVPLAEEEQSLEQIFKEFKKGVEQQLDSEDYDTHYNLGIAYKEMGLIDEAIGEFQLASKDPKRAVECASMLGLCFLEKGMPQLAIKWYRKGLEIPELTEEEHIGLLYDLGSAYVEVGDTANAQKAFLEVYGMNTNYRDVVSRIKQLEAAR